MSTNRFHNKFHRNNHHTDPTAGDIDSNYDPIASASQPFQGSFYGTGDLVLEDGSSAVITYLNAPTGNITLKTNLNIDVHEIIGLLLPMMGDVTLGDTVLGGGQILIFDGTVWRNETSLPDEFVGYPQLKTDFWGIGLVGGPTSADVVFTEQPVQDWAEVTTVANPAVVDERVDIHREDDVATQTAFGHVKMWVDGSVLYLSTT